MVLIFAVADLSAKTTKFYTMQKFSALQYVVSPSLVPIIAYVHVDVCIHTTNHTTHMVYTETGRISALFEDAIIDYS